MRKFLGDNSKTKKTIKRTMSFSERQYEMAELIAKRNGHHNFQSVIDGALELYYSKTNPNYIIGRASGDNVDDIAKSTGLSTEEVATRKINLKQAEKDAEMNAKVKKKTLICERDLHGRVETDESGFHYCYFKVHDTKVSIEQKMPLLQADPVIARGLFIPSKEMVLKARPELKKLYGNKEKETTKKEK